MSPLDLTPKKNTPTAERNSIIEKTMQCLKLAAAVFVVEPGGAAIKHLRLESAMKTFFFANGFHLSRLKRTCFMLS
jgi:hypothetical protein